MAEERLDRFLQILEAEGIDYKDNRSSNGCLWLFIYDLPKPFVRDCGVYGIDLKQDSSVKSKNYGNWWTTSDTSLLTEAAYIRLESCLSKAFAEAGIGAKHQNFDIVEAVLLLDVYSRRAAEGASSTDIAGEASGYLRAYAIAKGRRIDITFRSPKGLLGRIKSLETALGEGSGSTAGTRSFSEAIKLQREEHETFFLLRDRALEMIYKSADARKELESFGAIGNEERAPARRKRNGSQMKKKQKDICPTRLCIRRESIEVCGWVNTYVQLVQRIQLLFPEKIEAIMGKSLVEGSGIDFAGVGQMDRLAGPRRVARGLFVATRYSREELIERINALISYVELETDVVISGSNGKVIIPEGTEESDQTTGTSDAAVEAIGRDAFENDTTAGEERTETASDTDGDKRESDMGRLVDQDTVIHDDIVDTKTAIVDDAMDTAFEHLHFAEGDEATDGPGLDDSRIELRLDRDENEPRKSGITVAGYYGVDPEWIEELELLELEIPQTQRLRLRAEGLTTLSRIAACSVKQLIDYLGEEYWQVFEPILGRALKQSEERTRASREESGKETESVAGDTTEESRPQSESTVPEQMPDFRQWISDSERMQMTLAECFHVTDPEGYSIQIMDMDLSVRANNCLKSIGLKDLGQLLVKRIDELRATRNMGIRSLCETLECVYHYLQNGDRRDADDADAEEIPLIADSILAGEIEQALSDTIAYREFRAMHGEIAEGIDSILETVDKEMLLYCLSRGAQFSALSSSLKDYIKGTYTRRDMSDRLTTAIRELSEQRKSNSVSVFSAGYAKEHPEIKDSPAWTVLQHEITFAQLSKAMTDVYPVLSDEDIKVLTDFVRWASFDLAEETEDFHRDILKNMRESDQRRLEILRLRGKGMTLNELGTRYEITRERVRQLEKGATDLVTRKWRTRKYDLLELISMQHDGAELLQQEDICEALGEEMSEILWACIQSKDLKGKSWSYYPDIRSIVFVDAQMLSLVQELKSELPDIIETEKLPAMISAIAEKEDISAEILRLLLQEDYSIYGRFSSNKRITLRRMMEYIMKEYYPNGCKVGEGGCYLQLREQLAELFDYHEENTEHALATVVSKVGILYDRGTYIHPSNVHLDPGILEAVNAYLERDQRGSIPYTDIFIALKEVLLGYGITNRYYLQGALKELGIEYKTDRDNIIRDQKSDVALELQEYIRNQDGIVTREMIRGMYPSFTDARILMVVQRCDRIVQMPNGSYLNADHISTTEEELEQLYDLISAECYAGPKSTRVLINVINMELPDFVLRNCIDDYQTLYCILCYLLKGRIYPLGWSFISIYEIGVMNTTADVLKYWLKEYDTIDVEDLLLLCDDIGFNYHSIRSLIEWLAPDFVRTSGSTLCKAEAIGLTDEVATQAIELIGSIVEAQRWHSSRAYIDMMWLPSLTVDWTNELLESIVNSRAAIPCIRFFTPDFTLTNTIWISSDYKGDDYERFIIRYLIREQRVSSFRSLTEIHHSLQEAGICGVTLPEHLIKKHLKTNENGTLKVMLDEVQ